MKRAHCVIVGASSWLAGHTGRSIIGLAVVWMASAPSPAWSQSAWPSYPNNSAISVTSGGNVGIGTTSPSKINWASSPHSLITQIDGYLSVGNSGQGGNDDGLIQAGDAGFLSGNNWYWLASVGRNLAVKSVGNTDTFYTPIGHSWVGYQGIAFGAPGTGSATIDFFTYGGATTAGGAVTPTSRMRIDGSGKVGIGTTSPQYLLSVKGTVGAEEFIVTNTGWSDYVFQPGYRLRPLSEVGAYIEANHHLPDIPSEAEVKEKGVSLGEMQAKLLAKVEELTLHLIQQDRENRDLRERIARLEKGAAGDATPTAAQ